ncbi:MAG: NADH-quinone oxidoreductase subunit H [Campylobacterota bacterium]
MFKIVLLLLAPIIGGLIQGLERVVRARMQRRIGPPLLQPFYDMFKLLDKRAMIVNNLHTLFAIMHFVTLYVVVFMVIYEQNLLYIIFLHLLATAFLVIAGYSVRSIYSHIGSNRELLVLFVYEPILILLAVSFYLQNGSFMISDIFQNSANILHFLPLFFSLLIVAMIKLSKSPFDIAHAHQEIIGGVEIEYSGIFYEFLYMAKWLEYFFIFSLFWLLCSGEVIASSLLCAVVFLIINLIDNATARVQMARVLGFGMVVGIFLALLNIIGLYYV